MSIKKALCILYVFPILSLPLEAAKPRSGATGEDHPELRAALAALEKAKQTLEQGAGKQRKDDGRRKALVACERAIQQLKSALEKGHQ